MKKLIQSTTGIGAFIFMIFIPAAYAGYCPSIAICKTSKFFECILSKDSTYQWEVTFATGNYRPGTYVFVGASYDGSVKRGKLCRYMLKGVSGAGEPTVGGSTNANITPDNSLKTWYYPFKGFMVCGNQKTNWKPISRDRCPWK